MEKLITRIAVALTGCLLYAAAPGQQDYALSHMLASLGSDTARVRVLLNLSETLRESNIALSEQYASQALQLAQKTGDPATITRAEIEHAYDAGLQGRYLDAMAQLQRADSLASEHKLKHLVPYIQMVRGRLQFEKRFLPEALQDLLNALRGFETAGDSLGVAKTSSVIGSLHYYTGNTRQARLYLQRAEKTARESKENGLLAQVLLNISNCYAVEASFDTSNQLLHEALTLNQQLGNYGGMAKNYTNLAMNWYDQQRYDSALALFVMAYRYDSLWQNPVGMLYAKINMAAGYRKTGNMKKALALATEALQGARQLSDRHLQRTTLEDIADIYADMGNYATALNYHRQLLALKDSLLNEEKARQMADVQTRYQVDKKEQDLQLLEERRRADRTLLYALAALAAALIMAAVMQYRQHKNKLNLAAERLHSQEQQLGNYAAGLLQKDELLAEIENQLDELRNNANQQRFEQLENLLKARVSTHDDWTRFQSQFETLYPGFFAGLQAQFPQLSANEVKLCALEKLGLKDSQAGDLLGVNADSIRKARYRLRKSLGDGGWDQLRLFLMNH